MTDAVTIGRVDYDHPVTNPDTGLDEYPVTVLYTGAARVRPNYANRPATAGDSFITVIGYLVSVPLSVTNVRAGDVVTVTSSADGFLTDRTLKVRSIVAGTHVTARRLDCEEASG